METHVQAAWTWAYDDEGISYRTEACPRSERHHLTREPEGLWCHECREHLAECPDVEPPARS